MCVMKLRWLEPQSCGISPRRTAVEQALRTRPLEWTGLPELLIDAVAIGLLLRASVGRSQ